VKRSWHNYRYYLGVYLEGLRKTTKPIGQNSGSSGRNLNPRPPEYETGVLLTHLRRSVAMKITKIVRRANLFWSWSELVTLKCELDSLLLCSSIRLVVIVSVLRVHGVVLIFRVLRRKRETYEHNNSQIKRAWKY
jgi:hypothetical protein